MGEILAQHTPDEERRFRLNANPREERRVPDADIARYFASPSTVEKLFGRSQTADGGVGDEGAFARSAH